MAHQSTDSGSFFALTRHEEFHINGGDLFFLVEHVQFRVHRYFFERESAIFRNQLTSPASPGASRQGASESNAIVLENVRSADFAKFLWVFYNPKYSLYNTTPEDWTTILDLAHKWAFPEVKNLAVRELEKLELSDVDRISIYHKYEIDRNLLIPRYAALCERESPLTLQEGLQLGMETTLMIARAREYARANPTPSGARSPCAAGMQLDEMACLVREIFEVPAAASAEQDRALETSILGKPVTEEQSGNIATEMSADTIATSQTAQASIETTNGTMGAADTGNNDAEDPFCVGSPTRGRGKGRGRKN